MIIDPKYIKFESQNDVIDYVACGLPPRKKNFDAVMQASEFGEYNGVVVPSKIITMSNDDLQSVLQRVYADNKRNTIIAGAIIGALTIGLVKVCLTAGKKDNDDDERYN